MKVDAAILTSSLAEVPAAARALEDAGFDGAFTFDGPHDPFFPLVLAAEHTRRIALMTAVAVAFARSPMIVAQLADDLQRLSEGRFLLGLGSQIRPHVEKRFGQPWSRPAARMREFVLALRAIWRCWNEGEPLRFDGEFYRHTLMTPFFHPGPNPHGAPSVWLAGVGPRMTAVAGEVADGFLLHPFHTEAFLRETTLPALEAGLARAGRRRDELAVSAQVLVVTGHDRAESARADQAVRAQIAFYASTPAYRPVLDSAGRGALHAPLNRLSKRGQWAEMAALVDDDLVAAVALRGEPEEIADQAQARFGGMAERVSFVVPSAPEDPALVAEIARAVRRSRAR